MADLVAVLRSRLELKETPPALGPLLERRCAEAAGAWRGVDLDQERFVAFVADRMDPQSPLSSLDALCIPDLYVACACAEHIPAAIEQLETRYFPEVSRTLRGIGRLDADAALDVLQDLRERVLVGDGRGEPRIVDYLGRGPLVGWLCTAAVRSALQRLRRGNRETPSEDLEPLWSSPVEDPEIELLRRRFQHQFRAAFEHAVGTLDKRQRTVLRLNMVDGLNIERIGIIYAVHRATVARWIAAAREQIVRETRAELARNLRGSDSEIDSLVRGMEGQLEVSLFSLLRSRGE